jgi:hypothetical protein
MLINTECKSCFYLDERSEWSKFASKIPRAKLYLSSLIYAFAWGNLVDSKSRKHESHSDSSANIQLLQLLLGDIHTLTFVKPNYHSSASLTGISSEEPAEK